MLVTEFLSKRRVCLVYNSITLTYIYLAYSYEYSIPNQWTLYQFKLIFQLQSKLCKKILTLAVYTLSRCN